MATTTMRLGLLLMTALAIIHISKGEPETEDQYQLEHKIEGNMMATSMEEADVRTIREAGKKDKVRRRRKKNKAKKDRKSKRKSRNGAKKNKNERRKKKGAKNGRKSGKKSGNRAKRRRKKNRTKKGKTSDDGAKRRRKKERKPSKSAKKSRKIKKRLKQSKNNKPNGIVQLNRQAACDEAALCQKIKDYIKYSNQLRKVKRIVKSCDTMEKKANKSVTEFDATVAALDEVIASNAKRRLYIRWRRTQRSTDEVVAIRDNLKNCSVSVKAKCEKKVQPACLEIVLLAECEVALQAWLNKFGPKTGSCLQANADCCACITALGSVDAKCLDFDTKSTAAVKSKKTCTGSGTGAFGFCRKQQQEAAVKGPPAAQEACSGGTATKAPSAATTAAAGATTAAAAATTAAAQVPSLPTTSTTPLPTTSTTPLPTTSTTPLPTTSTSPLPTTTMVNLTLNVSSLEESVASLVELMDNLNINVEAIDTKVDTNTAKADANAVTIATKCDTTTCTAIQATITKLETCLADISSSDCPSPASGKTGVIGIIANTANIANKCDTSKCSTMETKATDADSCVADTSSASCPSPASGKTSITGAITNLETPTVFMCQFSGGDFSTSGTLAPYDSCDVNVDTVVDKATGIFTVAKPGKYRLTFMALMITSANKKVIAYLAKTPAGGTPTNIARSLSQTQIGTLDEQITTTLDIITELAAADTIHVALKFHANGGKITGSSSTAQVVFTGQLIS